MNQILILEPDKLLAYTYKKALENRRYSVITANSGQDALDSADTTKPDLILMELQLPAHDGLEFLYEFRTYSDWQDIPIMINSSSPPDRLKILTDLFAKELGIVSVHYKPLTNLESLVRNIDELMKVSAT